MTDDPGLASAAPVDGVAERLPRSRREALRQAIVTAAAGGVVFVLGTTLYTVAIGQPSGLDDWLWLLLSPQAGIWVVLVLAIGVLSRATSVAGFAVLATLLAPVATFLAFLLSSGVQGFVLALGLWPVSLWKAAGLTGAALIGAIVGMALATPGRMTRMRVVAALSLALLTAGAVLAFALPMQWFDVYFTLGGEAPTPTAADGDRYLWTAGLALVLLVVAVVLALVRRRGGLIALTSVAFGLAMIAAFLLQVPQNRFIAPAENPAPYNTNYVPCYSGSGDCVGG